MQLSYNNLIKSNNNQIIETKEIKTNYVSKSEQEKKEKKNPEDEIKKNYENLGSNIIRKAKSEAEALVMESRRLSFEIEKEAYEKGYSQGNENGYEDGFKKGYEDAVERVNKETEDAVKGYIDNANQVLLNASEDYKKYLDEKEKDIIKLAIEIAGIIAKKELSLSEGLHPLIEDVLNGAKGEETLIIRCHTEHIEAINDKKDYYKKAYGIKGDIFVLEDILMEPGNAIVEKTTGKSVIGANIAIEKLKEGLLD